MLYIYMTQKLNRRRYQEIVRFLKDTIKNKNLSHKIRMLAVVRLDAIYERQEAATMKREDREARARLAMPQAPAQAAVPDTPEPESPGDVRKPTVDEIFAQITRRTRSIESGITSQIEV